MESTTATQLDNRQVEIVGRSILVASLVADGLEVADPLRDRGVDLIAYNERGQFFEAIPIQLKASSKSILSINRKYETCPQLVMAFVWGCENPATSEIIAMRWTTLSAIAEELGWFKRRPWMERGSCWSHESTKIRTAVKPHIIKPGSWPQILESTAVATPQRRSND